MEDDLFTKQDIYNLFEMFDGEYGEYPEHELEGLAMKEFFDYCVLYGKIKPIGQICAI